MFYIMYLLFLIIILGLIGVASNPSPSFAALSLVGVAGGGCGILACHGGSFLSLVLFLIYLGGMMVVFAYSVAFTVNLNPEGWGSGSIMGSVVMYLFSVCVFMLLFVDGGYDDFWVVGANYYENEVVRGGVVGVSLLYSLGGLLLFAGAWGLLLVLFVVLKLVRGMSLGAIRVV